MKEVLIAILDGFNPENNQQDEEPQEQEGQDGIGLGEGLGDEDITNEIEDEAQLEGDNVNTNEDKQNEEDVDREGGFEMEQDMPEDAPDVSAGEEAEVSTEVVAAAGVHEIAAGDNIRVVFGATEDTIPIHVGNVFAIYLLDENGVPIGLD